MPRVDIDKPYILTDEQTLEIPFHIERTFARYLLTFPQFLFGYEVTRFERNGIDGRSGSFDENGNRLRQATLPDFTLISLINGREAFLELQRGVGRPERPIKASQRELMMEVAPDVSYRVIDGRKLWSIQQRHPEFAFFESNPRFDLPQLTTPK